MEHREPPRIAGDDRRLDGGHRGAGRTAIPVASVRARRAIRPRSSWCRRRLASRASVACCSAALIAYLGLAGGASRAVGWLHRQPQYQVPFERDPAGHRAAALVSGRLGGLSRTRAAGAREARARSRFLKCRPSGWPWPSSSIRGWKKSSRWPTARAGSRSICDYRQPVAWVKLPAGQQQVIDRREGRYPARRGRRLRAAGPRDQDHGRWSWQPPPTRGRAWSGKRRTPRAAWIEQVDDRDRGGGPAGRVSSKRRAASAKPRPRRHCRIIEIIVTNMSDFSTTRPLRAERRGSRDLLGRGAGAESQVNRRRGKVADAPRVARDDDSRSLARRGLLAVFEKRARHDARIPSRCHAPFKRLRARSNRLASRAIPPKSTGSG